MEFQNQFLQFVRNVSHDDDDGEEEETSFEEEMPQIQREAWSEEEMKGMPILQRMDEDSSAPPALPQIAPAHAEQGKLSKKDRPSAKLCTSETDATTFTTSSVSGGTKILDDLNDSSPAMCQHLSKVTEFDPVKKSVVSHVHTDFSKSDTQSSQESVEQQGDGIDRVNCLGTGHNSPNMEPDSTSFLLCAARLRKESEVSRGEVSPHSAACSGPATPASSTGLSSGSEVCVRVEESQAECDSTSMFLASPSAISPASQGEIEERVCPVLTDHEDGASPQNSVHIQVCRYRRLPPPSDLSSRDHASSSPPTLAHTAKVHNGDTKTISSKPLPESQKTLVKQTNNRCDPKASHCECTRMHSVCESKPRVHESKNVRSEPKRCGSDPQKSAYQSKNKLNESASGLGTDTVVPFPAGTAGSKAASRLSCSEKQSLDSKLSSTAKQSLDNKQSSATKQSLDNKHSSSSTTKQSLDNKQSSSSMTKQSLDSKQSSTAKQCLDNKQSSSSTTKQSLDNKQSSSSTTKQSLDNKQSFSSTTKQSLDSRQSFMTNPSLDSKLSSMEKQGLDSRLSSTAKRSPDSKVSPAAKPCLNSHPSSARHPSQKSHPVLSLRDDSSKQPSNTAAVKVKLSLPLPEASQKSRSPSKSATVKVKLPTPEATSKAQSNDAKDKCYKVKHHVPSAESHKKHHELPPPPSRISCTKTASSKKQRTSSMCDFPSIDEIDWESAVAETVESPGGGSTPDGESKPGIILKIRTKSIIPKPAATPPPVPSPVPAAASTPSPSPLATTAAVPSAASLPPPASAAPLPPPALPKPLPASSFPLPQPTSAHPLTPPTSAHPLPPPTSAFPLSPPPPAASDVEPSKINRKRHTVDTPEIMSRLRNREKIPKVEQQQQQPEPDAQKKQQRTRKDSEVKRKPAGPKKRDRRHSVQLGGDLTARVDHLPPLDRTFALTSIKLYQLQKLTHDVLSSLSPRLCSKLSDVSPDSSTFTAIIDDTIASLESSEPEEVELHFNEVCKLLEKLRLESSRTVPVYMPQVSLCRSPQHAVEEFQDKVCCLLQLMLPDVGLSFGESLSKTGDDLLALLKWILRANKPAVLVGGRKH